MKNIFILLTLALLSSVSYSNFEVKTFPLAPVFSSYSGELNCRVFEKLSLGIAVSHLPHGPIGSKYINNLNAAEGLVRYFKSPGKNGSFYGVGACGVAKYSSLSIHADSSSSHKSETQLLASAGIGYRYNIGSFFFIDNELRYHIKDYLGHSGFQFPYLMSIGFSF